jgi:hypothetical protein
MSRTTTVRTAALAILFLGILGDATARAGSALSLNVDTSALNGQSGYLDIQFNPGDSTALSATVTVSNFQTSGGSLVQPSTLTGDASGSLPGTLTLDNGTPYNDIFQGFTFGTNFSLDVDFSGPAVDSPGGTTGSSFALSLYAADGVTPLLTTDPNGSVATLNLNADGTITVMTFPQSPTNTTPVVTYGPATATPEPSTIAILISSLPVGLISWCRRRQVTSPPSAARACSGSPRRA